MRPDPGETEKRTNEIGTILPLLETVPDIARRTVTTDALLTQRVLATYLLGRGAHYLFTVKGNQPNMQGGFVLHGFLNPPNEITAGLDILPAL